MDIVGAIYTDEETLTTALDALEEAGFTTYMVFGRDDFSGEPGMDNAAESSTRRHTAAGTIGGISVNPPAEIPDEPSTETVEDELMAVGLSQSDARSFISAMQQDRLLLLVPTWSGRTADLEQLLRAHEGHELRSIHPQDAFPEELWRPET